MFFDFFKKKSNNKEKEENRVDRVINIIESKQTITSKLDFNFEHMNKYLMKCIKECLLAKYKQNSNLAKKYVTEKFYKSLCKEIEQNKNLFRYSNENINIIKAELVNQEIESVNYISQITIHIKISAIYYRENIFTETIRQVHEIYSEDVVYKNCDEGWKIDRILNQNFDLMDDDTFIKI